MQAVLEPKGDTPVAQGVLVLEEGEQQVHAQRELEMWPRGGKT